MRHLLLLALLAALVAPGCKLLPSGSEVTYTPPAIEAPPGVQPDEVTAANARRKAGELEQELERDKPRTKAK